MIGSWPVEQRNYQTLFHIAFHNFLDKTEFRLRDRCNVGIESSARLNLLVRNTRNEINDSLPSGQPLIHSALLSIGRVLLPLSSWSSEIGSMMFSVRSFEKKTLAYGSAMVLSAPPVVQYFIAVNRIWHTKFIHPVIFIATQALGVIIMFHILLIHFKPWSRTFSLQSALLDHYSWPSNFFLYHRYRHYHYRHPRNLKEHHQIRQRIFVPTKCQPSNESVNGLTAADITSSFVLFNAALALVLGIPISKSWVKADIVDPRGWQCFVQGKVYQKVKLSWL